VEYEESYPVIIGALGVVTKDFQKYIGRLYVHAKLGVIQKTALLVTARSSFELIKVLIGRQEMRCMINISS